MNWFSVQLIHLYNYFPFLFPFRLEQVQSQHGWKTVKTWRLLKRDTMWEDIVSALPHQNKFSYVSLTSGFLSFPDCQSIARPLKAARWSMCWYLCYTLIYLPFILLLILQYILDISANDNNKEYRQSTTIIWFTQTNGSFHTFDLLFKLNTQHNTKAATQWLSQKSKTKQKYVILIDTYKFIPTYTNDLYVTLFFQSQDPKKSTTKNPFLNWGKDTPISSPKKSKVSFIIFLTFIIINFLGVTSLSSSLFFV